MQFSEIAVVKSSLWVPVYNIFCRICFAVPHDVACVRMSSSKSAAANYVMESTLILGVLYGQMDGWEATRQIRKWEVESCAVCQLTGEPKCSHHHLPIVAVTADVMKGTHATCFSSGMDDYITKVNPISLAQLCICMVSTLILSFLVEQGPSITVSSNL